MAYYVGIDLGGTNIVAGVVDERCQILAKAETKTRAPRPAEEICADMGRMGCERLYLVTEHMEFYERCGWSFLTLVQGEDGTQMRLYASPILKKG